ncbi:MAG: DUF1800 domain-containing protein [Acidobacteriota bacterium]
MASLNFDEAAHLLRRMGFGGPPEELEFLTTLGREGAVDALINYTQTDNSALDDLIAQSFDFSNPDIFERFNRGELQRWWMTRMVYSKRPFEEKMTLFWHNHFATAANKVDDRFMFVQNLKLRAQALDRFDNLLLTVSQDPAMLIWLDGIVNVRGKPNENFARELQELFTMGIKDVVTGEANYTEQDVQEIARAFTGWKFFFNRGTRDPFNYPFLVNPAEHDELPKTVYGQTANFTGQDIISIVSNKRATGRFLVYKFFNFFVYPLDTANAADRSTIEKFADVYFASNHSIKELARAIFVSDEFFSERARFALVKTPVELVVGAVRMLGARYNPGDYNPRTSSNILAQIVSFLGQELFNPPDVAGWRLQLGWINTSWLLNRYTFADFLTISRTADLNAPGVWIPHDQIKRYTKANVKKTVRNFLSVLGPLPVDASVNLALRNYLQTGDDGNPVTFVKDDLTVDKKVRGLVHLMMSLSEFQLN